MQDELKASSRSNYSVSELLRPEFREKRKFGVDPNHLLDKLCKDEPEEKV